MQPAIVAKVESIAPSSSEIKDETTFLALYQQFRSYLEHEDELMNARISRTLLLHGFLFAAYSILIQASSAALSQPFGDGSPCTAEKTEKCVPALLEPVLAGTANLLLIIGAVGVVTSFGAIIGVHAAASAIKELRKRWDAISKAHSDLVGRLHLPGITGGGAQVNERWGGFSTHLVPCALLLLWVCVVVNTIAPSWFRTVVSSALTWALSRVL